MIAVILAMFWLTFLDDTVMARRDGVTGTRTENWVGTRGVTNPVFDGYGSGTGTTTKGVGVGVAWIRIFPGIGSTHGIGSFWVCTSLILIQEAPSV